MEATYPVTIDDIMNPVYAESRRAAEAVIACAHALAIIDEHLARLRVQVASVEEAVDARTTDNRRGP